jgi:preprotein translocase subunit SecG
VSFHGIDSVLRIVIFAVGAMIAVLLLSRTRRQTLVPYLGLALIAFAVGGPALWPWYLSWGLVLVAAWEPTQRSWLVVAGLLVGAMMVKPGGILALPLGSSPVVTFLWLALGLLLGYRWRRRRRLDQPITQAGDPGASHSFLVER